MCQGWGSARLEFELQATRKRVAKHTKRAQNRKTVSLEIIDDGETVEMSYIADGERYSLEAEGKSSSAGNHIAIFNREQPYCIVDISSLCVSVVVASQDQ